jgi:hypothetical protein
MKVFETEMVTDRITVVWNYKPACDEHIDRNDHLVIIGHPGYSKVPARTILDYENAVKQVTRPPIYVVSGRDMTFVEQNSLDSELWHTVSWFQSQYISASFQLANFNKYVVTSGGFQSNWHSWDRARSNMQQAFVAWYRGKNWHDTYDGRFGYVISGSYSEKQMHQHSVSLYVAEPNSASTVCHVGPRGVNLTKVA